MGMLSAMYSGVSGLNVHGRALSGVADNIANLNTTGYKAHRTNFGDIMVDSLTAGGNTGQQVGTGARVMNVQNIMNQGSFETTDVNTDLGISGKGFFEVSDPTDQTGYYTRAGQFLMDKEGYLVNPLGYRLQGYNVDANGDLLQVVEDLRVLTQQADAIATTKVDLSVNLDAEDTKVNSAATAITPEDTDSWNYLTTTRTYDSLGVSHDLSLYFQRLDGNPSVTPAGTSTTWKVSLFENDGTTLSPEPGNPPENTFYLCFDTDGHLVGTTNYYGLSALGDIYTSSASVSSATSTISDRVGEEFSFTGLGAQQTYRTYGGVAITGNCSAGDSIRIGSDTYTLVTGGAAAASAAEFADLINNDATGTREYWAMDDGAGGLSIYANPGYTFNVTEVSDANGSIAVDDATNMTEVANAINSGLGGRGAMHLSAVPAAGWSVTIGTTTLTEGVDFVNGADAATTATNLAAAVNALAGYNSSATGSNVYLTSTTTGTASNVGISTTGGASVVLSDSNLRYGMDGSGTTAVSASAYSNSAGSYSLRLARTDAGSTATVTIASSNTLGDGIGLDFDTFTHNQFAADAEPTPTPETTGSQTLTFNFPNATPSQAIAFSFIPGATSASTQSAGTSETFYLYQDGAPRGTLQSLTFDRDGLISGQFSNGTLKTLGAVVLTNFANPESLIRRGDGLWEQSLDAGTPVTNRPGTAGLGDLESGALEQSTVDLAQEFVRMINYQRAFQANTRTITTTDQMLQELINLKR